MWGLNGPSTARVLSMDRQIGLRHALAFQCIVNIGVRGSEAVRTRVVQSGSLDLIAHILEEWLIAHDIVTEPNNLGSREAVEAAIQGRSLGQEHRRKHRAGSRHTARETSGETQTQVATTEVPVPTPRPQHRVHTETRAVPNNTPTDQPIPQQTDTDVDMADNEQDGMSEVASAAGDIAMDGDVNGAPQEQVNIADRAAAFAAAAAAATPRATNHGLPSRTMEPLPIDIPQGQPIINEDVSGASSGANSFSNGVDSGAVSEQEAVDVADMDQHPHRPPPLNLAVARIPALAQGGISNQSSPMGTPTRMEAIETLRPAGRRDTIVARPIVLVAPAPRLATNAQDTAESGASDVGDEPDMTIAAVAAGLQEANRREGAPFLVEEPAAPPNIEIVEREVGVEDEEPDAETLAAEQARLDLEAGAPPGQPGAMATPPAPATATPGVEVQLVEATTGAPVTTTPAGDPPVAQPQVIIAAGAPRGFHDLASYLGIHSVTNPGGQRFSDDCVLLALQLLAYLSKYPHVRNTFHHPRRPMHPTFDLGLNDLDDPLPALPHISQTHNVFSLVERYTFRNSVTDPNMYKIPEDLHYWAGVIMRNACRKDDARAGIRQCAHMSCGKWEKSAREFAKCRRCRKAKYCSKECQSKAWSEGHRFW